MEESLLKLGADALRKAALQEDAKAYILHSPKLYNILKKAANRFIGGETLSEAVASIKSLNSRGFAASTDFIGENIRNEKDALEATQEFVNLARAIKREHLESTISLDLTHIGLLVSKDLAKDNLLMICDEAKSAGKDVIVGMEGTHLTDLILEVYQESLDYYTNLGITLQAYLHRTEDDFKDIAKLPGSIRMVKGAYEVSKKISFERGPKLDEVYLGYVESLFIKDHKCFIASHDQKIHQETIKLAELHKPTQYELERLLGIGNEELDEFRKLGYPCKIYVVYGKDWYLYLCNRIAEYPQNIFLALNDMVN